MSAYFVPSEYRPLQEHRWEHLIQTQTGLSCVQSEEEFAAADQPGNILLYQSWVLYPEAPRRAYSVALSHGVFQQPLQPAWWSVDSGEFSEWWILNRERAAFHVFDEVWAVSEYTAYWILKLHGEHCTVVHLPVEPYRGVDRKTQGQVCLAQRPHDDRLPQLVELYAERRRDLNFIWCIPHQEDLCYTLRTSAKRVENLLLLRTWSREQYLRVLETSEFIFTTAGLDQIAVSVLEAMVQRVKPVVPDAFGYDEVLPRENRYEQYSFSDMDRAFQQARVVEYQSTLLSRLEELQARGTR